MPNEKYKYLRRDFGELPVKLEHLDIYLNFLHDDKVEAVNCLRMTAARELDRIELDARDLEIVSVEWCSGPDSDGTPLQYEYIVGQNKLIVLMPRKVPW